MRFVCTVFPSVFLLAAITLSGGRLCAAHVEATFGIALTNETDWAFGPGVLINKESGYPYIARMDDGFIASPNFGFAITSVTVEAWNATANTTRKVDLTPIAPSGFRGNPPETCRLDLSEDPRKLTFTWPRESAVQALTIRFADGGNGNVYFRSIVIDGAPLIPIPTNLSVAAVYGESFVARWENGDGICSNRLSVFRKDLKAFDFARPAGRNPTNISVEVLGPGFSGANLYSATNADGVVQIGTTEKRGWLAYSDSASFRNRQLVMTVRRYPHEGEAKYMMLQWMRGGETNDIARIDLADAPGDRTVSLSSVPDGATLLISPPRVRNARILLSRFGFISPVGTHTIPSTGIACKHRFCVPGLTRNTAYLWKVSAFAADGTESPDSTFVPVQTNTLPSPGLVIRFR